MSAAARLAVELERAVAADMARAYAAADGEPERRAVRAAWVQTRALIPRMARALTHYHGDSEVIAHAPVPQHVARWPRGREVFRHYAATVVGDFRRQQAQFDHWATATGLLVNTAGRTVRDGEDSEDPADAMAGWTGGLDMALIWPAHLDAFDAAGTRALRDLGIDNPFQLVDPTLMNRVRQLLLDQIGGIDSTTRLGLLRVLQDHAGETVAELGQAIADYWDQAGLARGLLIASTEMARAGALAEIETYSRNGVGQVVFSGNASLDEGGGPEDCNNYLGEVYTVDAAEGVIPIHPRCTHYWSPVIPADWDLPATPWAGGNLSEQEMPSLEDLLATSGRAARMWERWLGEWSR